MVRKGFGNVPLKDVTMERVRVEEFEESLYENWGMSQSFFSLEFLSQYSLKKLSTICGCKGYLYLYVFGMRKVSFSKIELAGGLALRLD